MKRKILQIIKKTEKKQADKIHVQVALSPELFDKCKKLNEENGVSWQSVLHASLEMYANGEI